jgi:hypothetical protein
VVTDDEELDNETEGLDVEEVLEEVEFEDQDEYPP